ncbi:MAG: DUF2309 domain-containing protein [Thermoanaerobaculia bacterium]
MNAVDASPGSSLASAPGRLPPNPRLDDAVAQACARIAPTWPLDRFIAVNPFWGMIDRSLPAVAGALLGMSGSRLLMPRAWYRQAHAEGRFRDEHLQAALHESGSSKTVHHLRALLASDEPAVQTRSRVVDVVDAGRNLLHEVSWRDFVANSVSQFCAAYFDDGQALLTPERTGGLFATWRRQALDDKSPSLLMRLRSYRDATKALPATASAMLQRGLSELDVPAGESQTYLWGLLLDQNGWASWCAYRRWNARLAGGDDDAIVDLLAIRLAWEWLLHGTGGHAVDRRWQLAMATWPAVDAATHAFQADDWFLQRAMELAWHETIVHKLPAGLSAKRPAAPHVQAVFCIDVRSEVFRRALEAQGPAVQTLGFAGFFGLPIAYQPLGAVEMRPQLPGLLAPRLLVEDTGLDAADAAHRAGRLDLARSWRSFKAGAVSTLTFVEAMGLTYAAKLLADSLGRSPGVAEDDAGLSRAASGRRKPRLVGSVDGDPLALGARGDLAAGILRAMSLTKAFARLVLLSGHGSETRNNPHAAGLHCGACCGQTGEINARAAAALLNDRDVRQDLSARGIHVPDETWFVAGLHDTTTDDVALFDLDELPASHTAELAALRGLLANAGERARAERSRSLGLGGVEPSRLHEALRARTRDWAQVRPEWGLANNASFIVAPREHCRHLNLEGRSFLHEYRFEEDKDFATLELIMTAPMVVAHWINLQYYASTVDNARYGSGNKVLHNVVGGHLGVFEGNGGDLRIGLPMQSVHDGQRWVHTPLRLSVFIEAPCDAIDAVLRKHGHVRALVANGWLDLFQVDSGERAIRACREAGWVRQKSADA